MYYFRSYLDYLTCQKEQLSVDDDNDALLWLLGNLKSLLCSSLSAIKKYRVVKQKISSEKNFFSKVHLSSFE